MTVINNFPKLGRFFDFTKKKTKILVKAELPIHWKTPVGFNIVQKYNETKDLKVHTQIQFNKYTTVMKTKTG